MYIHIQSSEILKDPLHEAACVAVRELSWSVLRVGGSMGSEVTSTMPSPVWGTLVFIMCLCKCLIQSSWTDNGPWKTRSQNLQVSLYISSGVCGKGSVFFFEPGLERCLLALQSNVVPSSKAVLFRFAYARRWLDKLTPLWKVALQWTHTFLLNSPFSDIEFGSEAVTLDPALCSLVEESVNEFLDIWEELLSLASSWHFLFFRIPIKAVVPESEFLTSNLVSSCLLSDSISVKENVDISGLASVQTLGIEFVFGIPTGGGVKRSALDSFGEAPYWKWFRLFPRIWSARWNSFLSRINSRSKNSGDLFFVEKLLPSFLRWPRMWLDCPVLLSNESPHNGQEWMLFTVSESDSICNAFFNLRNAEIFRRIRGRLSWEATCSGGTTWRAL